MRTLACIRIMFISIHYFPIHRAIQRQYCQLHTRWGGLVVTRFIKGIPTYNTFSYVGICLYVSRLWVDVLRLHILVLTLLPIWSVFVIVHLTTSFLCAVNIHSRKHWTTNQRFAVAPCVLSLCAHCIRGKALDTDYIPQQLTTFKCSLLLFAI